MIRRTLAVVLLLLGALGVATAEPVDGLAPEGQAHIHIAALIQESAALSLPVRVDRAFRLTLNAAHDALQEGRGSRALTLLRTFAFEVRGVKRAKRLRADVADALLARTEEAIGALGGSR